MGKQSLSYCALFRGDPSGKSAMPWLSVAFWSFLGVRRSRPPGGGSLWGPGLGPLYALDKLVRACASSPKISWGGHQILPNADALCC